MKRIVLAILVVGAVFVCFTSLAYAGQAEVGDKAHTDEMYEISKAMKNATIVIAGATVILLIIILL